MTADDTGKGFKVVAQLFGLPCIYTVFPELGLAAGTRAAAS